MAMLRSLAFKWTVTLLLTSLIGVILAGIFAYRTTVTEFDRLLTDQSETDYIDAVKSYYQIQNSWDGLDTWLTGEQTTDEEASRFRRLPPLAMINNDGIVVADHPPLQLGQQVSDSTLSKGTPVLIDGVQVGTALLIQRPELDPREQKYIDQTNRALFIGAFGASFTALVVGLLLSRQFLHPLSDLTRAITAMRAGNLDQHVTIRSNDELGTLAQTFNEMSATITRANRLREQMTADIAHDLRTPLTVIGGYLEALQDGTFKPTMARFQVMSEEVTLLKRLVEDLRTLSLADSGELKLICSTVDPYELLKRVATSFQESAATANIALIVDVSSEVSTLWGDNERLIQVVSNLVANALRHTTSGEQITLAARQNNDIVELIVRDTGTGIAPEDLPKIFDRFYRSDPSRESESGESGLGLAIARSIVEAHGGTISADSTLGEGTTMIIRLSSNPT